MRVLDIYGNRFEKDCALEMLCYGRLLLASRTDTRTNQWVLDKIGTSVVRRKKHDVGVGSILAPKNISGVEKQLHLHLERFLAVKRIGQQVRRRLLL